MNKINFKRIITSATQFSNDPIRFPKTLDLKNSINNKKSYGGTAISEIRKMISLARKELKDEKY